MIHPDRKLRDIVSAELGIIVHDIPEARIYELFIPKLRPMVISKFQTAYILFLGVWYYG